MNLKTLKINLPENWREASRFGTENSIHLRLYHISPVTKFDPKITQDQSLPSSSPNVTITKVGIPVESGPLQYFYDGMKGYILSGAAPPNMTLAWLDKLWKQMTETPMAERPGESDWAGEIVIGNLQNEKIAKQSFKNMALMPTMGFDVPIPMAENTQIPGAPKDLTMYQYVENLDKYMSREYLEKYFTKEQLEKMEPVFEKIKKAKPEIEKMKSELKEIQEQQIPQIKEQFSKSGVKYKEGKYLGQPVIYLEFPNPQPASKPRAKSTSKKTSGGGGGYQVLDPLPKVSRPYQKMFTFYQAMLAEKKFIINGSFLWTIASFPSGNTPCYSFTKTKKKTRFSFIGGVKFTDIYIVPLVSNYAKEGYLYKEEAEKILKTIISALQTFK